jgi:hypothetical protein
MQNAECKMQNGVGCSRFAFCILHFAFRPAPPVMNAFIA